MKTANLLAAAALSLTAASATAQGVNVHFENFPGGGPVSEGDLIGNQFLASHGVSFALEGGGFPQIGMVGLPRVAFDGLAGAPDGPVAGQGLGSFFLTDDQTANAPLAGNVIISWTAPVAVASADLIDVDGGEAWTLEARGVGGGVLETLTVAAGDPGTGNGIATRWSFSRPSPDITSVRIAYTGAQIPVGWALDNVSAASKSVSYCTAGVSASGCQAVLSAKGNASATAPEGYVVMATQVEAHKDGLFFYGVNGRQASAWGSGTSFMCVVPPVMRGGLLTGQGLAGLSCSGKFAQDLNARWCPSCPKPNHNPGVGNKVQIQLWYRDPMNTSNQTTSLSDALETLVLP